tara:strand:+ start:893 stop:1609 length:717 start_codon:yes stop_codon:yes gene_type:complete
MLVVEFVPATSGLVQSLVAASGTLANLALCIEPYQNDSYHTLGICLDGPYKGKALKIVRRDQDVVTSDVVQSCTLKCYATEGNPLRLPTGTTLVLSIGDEIEEDDARRETIGIAFSASLRSLLVELVVCASIQKARSQVKRVTLSDGTVLNREMSIRAFCAWLDYQNKMHAHKFGVSQLVWCVHHGAKSTTRVFWRFDFTDSSKKVCANINAAISHMEKVIGRDFLEDMRVDGIQSVP